MSSAEQRGSVHRDEEGRVMVPSGGALPRRCVRCGAEGRVDVQRTLTTYYIDGRGAELPERWGGAGGPTREERRANVQYSLCGPHAFRRKWGPWIGVVLGVTGAGILLDGLFLQDASLSVGGLACVGVSLAVYVISGGDPVKLHKLEGGVAWLDGIHRSIVEGIPAHPRPLDEIIATRGLVLTRSDDESSEDLSSPDRVPCPDEGCVGAVGADGRCGTCGALAR